MLKPEGVLGALRNHFDSVHAGFMLLMHFMFYCMFVLVHLLLRKAFALKITIQEEGRQGTRGEKVWPRKTGCKPPESMNDSGSSDGGDGFRP